MKMFSALSAGRTPLIHNLLGSIGSTIICLFIFWFIGSLSVMPPDDEQHKQHQAIASASSTLRTGLAVESLTPTGPGREIMLQGRKIFIPDVSLVDQNGSGVRLYEDLIKGKTVAIGFFYTRCTYICTRHGELFQGLQKELGTRLGKDLFLVSINMDPQFDTSEVIARWGRDYGRQKGWTLVTGPLEEMNKALVATTADSAGPRDEHGTFFYIGNDQTGNWELMYVGMSPRMVAKRLKELASSAK